MDLTSVVFASAFAPSGGRCARTGADVGLVGSVHHCRGIGARGVVNRRREVGTMKTRCTSCDTSAPVEVMWELLIDVDRWPEWGPSVRRATLATNRFALGSRGTVRTVIGLELPFEVTRFEEGRSWSWSVAGCPATDHVVEGRGPGLCRVTFGVPRIAAPYLVVCRIALRRLDELGRREVTSRRVP